MNKRTTKRKVRKYPKLGKYGLRDWCVWRKLCGRLGWQYIRIGRQYYRRKGSRAQARILGFWEDIPVQVLNVTLANSKDAVVFRKL